MDGHSKRVSVVIPTYNRADVLGSAIDSALDQTYDDLEVIVVDDGSTDDTSDVVDRYGANVRYHKFDENRGANAARNAGIDIATGEYIAFLDADDRWKSEKIARQVARFHEMGPECGLVHTGIERRKFDGDIIDRRIPPEPTDPERRLLFGNFVGTYSCILVRSVVFDTVGTPDEDLPSWQDWEFYLRVADEFEFALVPEPLTVKRVGRDDQISRNIGPLIDETYPTFESIITKRTEKYGTITSRRALAMLDKEVADAALMNGNCRQARQFLVDSLVLYPFDVKSLVLLMLSFGGDYAYQTALRTKSAIESIRRSL